METHWANSPNVAPHWGIFFNVEIYLGYLFFFPPMCFHIGRFFSMCRHIVFPGSSIGCLLMLQAGLLCFANGFAADVL